MRLHRHDRRHSIRWSIGIGSTLGGLIVSLGRVHLHIGGKG
jgi:hypothetical protein